MTHAAIIICGECNHHFPIGLGLASAVTCLACRVVIQIAEPEQDGECGFCMDPAMIVNGKCKACGGAPL